VATASTEGGTEGAAALAGRVEKKGRVACLRVEEEEELALGLGLDADLGALKRERSSLEGEEEEAEAEGAGFSSWLTVEGEGLEEEAMAFGMELEAERVRARSLGVREAGIVAWEGKGGRGWRRLSFSSSRDAFDFGFRCRGRKLDESGI